MQTQTQPQTSNTTIVVVNSSKSTGVAFLLSFFFGPLGLLYASIVGGIVMFFVTAILFFLIPVVGAILGWIICIIWAMIAVQATNSKAHSVTSVRNG